MQTNLAKKHARSKMALTVAFAVICIVYRSRPHARRTA